MNILIILAHPNPDSFNHAIAHAATDALQEKNHTVVFHDLYAERFDPILTREELSKNHDVGDGIRRHCRELAACDGLIVVHPNWWGQQPAILKGWIDRILIPDVAYRFREDDSGGGIPIGLLKGKKALILNTSDTPDEREHNVFGDPLENIWKKCICEFCGISMYRRRMFSVIVDSTHEQRSAWLEEVKRLVRDMVINNSGLDA